MYKNLVSELVGRGYDLTKDAYALSDGERAMYDDFAAKYSYRGEQDFYVVLQNIYFNKFLSNAQHEIVCVCCCDDDFVRMFNIALANCQK